MRPKAKPRETGRRGPPARVGVTAHNRAGSPAFRAVVLLPCVLMVGLIIGLDDRTALALYGGLSLLVAVLFVIDKRQAVTAGSRISERMLLGLSFLGGWPGALVTGQLIRHKTRKLAFRLPLWAAVALHLGLWVWLVANGQTLADVFPGAFPA